MPGGQGCCEFGGHLDECLRRADDDRGVVVHSTHRDAPHAVHCVGAACGVAERDGSRGVCGVERRAGNCGVTRGILAGDTHTEAEPGGVRKGDGVACRVRSIRGGNEAGQRCRERRERHRCDDLESHRRRIGERDAPCIAHISLRVGGCEILQSDGRVFEDYRHAGSNRRGICAHDRSRVLRKMLDSAKREAARIHQREKRTRDARCRKPRRQLSEHSAHEQLKRIPCQNAFGVARTANLQRPNIARDESAGEVHLDARVINPCRIRCGCNGIMGSRVEHRIADDKRVDISSSVTRALHPHIRSFGIDAAAVTGVADVWIKECVEELRILNRLRGQDRVVRARFDDGFRRKDEARRRVIRYAGVEDVIHSIWQSAKRERVIHFDVISSRQCEQEFEEVVVEGRAALAALRKIQRVRSATATGDETSILIIDPQ